MVDERLEPRGEHGGHDVEAVRRAAVEPVLDRVGDLLGRAGERAVAPAAAEPADQLTHGELLPAGELDGQRVAALGALDLVLVGQVGRQLAVEGQVLGVDPQRLGQLPAGVLGPDQLVESALEREGLGLRAADDRDDAGQDLDARRVATVAAARRLMSA